MLSYVPLDLTVNFAEATANLHGMRRTTTTLTVRRDDSDNTINDHSHQTHVSDSDSVTPPKKMPRLFANYSTVNGPLGVTEQSVAAEFAKYLATSSNSNGANANDNCISFWKQQKDNYSIVAYYNARISCTSIECTGREGIQPRRYISSA